MNPTESDLVAWFESGPGKRVAAAERRVIEARVRRFHGDELLWLGPPVGISSTTARCMVRDRFLGGQMAPTPASEADHAMVTDYRSLPLSAGRMDGVVLHHALDLSRDRRATLREATRVLRPGGRMLIVGFNPFSATALSKPRRPFRAMRSLSVWRLKEWLSVLGLEASRPAYLAYRGALPFEWQSERLDSVREVVGDWQLPLGGVYALTATKVAFGTIEAQRRFSVESQSIDSIVVHPAAVRSRETL